MSASELMQWSLAKVSYRLRHHGNEPSSSRSEVASFAGKLTGISRLNLNEFYHELEMAPFQEAMKEVQNIDPGSHFGVDECLYVLCRAIKPNVIIETGVFHGISSAHILYALQRNNAGKLISIDLPHASIGHREVGWFVPSELKARWALMLGSSQELLPKVIESADSVDIFMHDSEHSEKNMMFEYEQAWPKISSGGLLLSDDTDWNLAFSRFAVTHQMERSSRALCFGCRLGGLRKK